MTTRVIYLDNNATTQCAPEVVDAMLPFFAGKHGNTSSPHFLGREAARAVTVAREHIAKSVGCNASDVFFTSCATESNNLVILGAAQMSARRRKIVTSVIEHKSVLGPCEALENKGFNVVRLPVGTDGLLDLDTVRHAVDSDTVLVSVQGANNEIGVIQPIKAIADIAHAAGAALHCDAAQLLGKLPVSINDLGADFASFSSHKAYGPKGIGFLTMRSHVTNVTVSPLMFGGGQENGFRPGTLNVPGIVGTGVACRLLTERMETEMREVGRLRDQLEDGIRTIAPDAQVVGSEASRLPGTLSVMFPGISAELLIARTPTVCMSMGSACSSGTVSPSHVLLALGMTRDNARCVVRLSLGRYSTDAEVQEALKAIGAALHDVSVIETSERK